MLWRVSSIKYGSKGRATEQPESVEQIISQYCSSQSKDAPAINYKYLNISWNIILSQLYDWAIIASVSVRMQTFIMRHLTIHSANNV